MLKFFIFDYMNTSFSNFLLDAKVVKLCELPISKFSKNKIFFFFDHLYLKRNIVTEPRRTVFEIQFDLIANNIK